MVSGSPAASRRRDSRGLFNAAGEIDPTFRIWRWQGDKCSEPAFKGKTKELQEIYLQTTLTAANMTLTGTVSHTHGAKHPIADAAGVH
jgi:hypothetical protein